MRKRSFLCVLVLLMTLLISCQASAASMKLSAKKMSLTEGKSKTLSVKNKNSADTVTWTSSKPAVATVDSNGTVTAVKAGKTTITASINGKTFKCKVTVKKWKAVAMKKLANYSTFKRYMTDAQMKKAYNKAYQIVKPLAGLSKKEQLYGIAVALRKLVNTGKVRYSTSAAHYNDPYGYLVKGVASCAGCARTTGFCLNLLGIKYEHVNENKWKHQWARVKVGSQYWICDPYGCYVGVEPGVRKHPYL